MITEYTAYLKPFCTACIFAYHAKRCAKCSKALEYKAARAAARKEKRRAAIVDRLENENGGHFC